jgi:hypothetical protein
MTPCNFVGGYQSSEEPTAYIFKEEAQMILPKRW